MAFTAWSDASAGLRDAARRTVRELLLFGLAGGWTVFWLNVVRLHLVRGHPVDAGATLLITVLPVAGGYVWRTLTRLSSVDHPAGVLPSPLEG